MGTHINNDYGVDVRDYANPGSMAASPASNAVLPLAYHDKHAISDWIEMWDYVGGIRFRGFVAEKDNEKAMFVFFDQSVIEGDLKSG